MMQLVYITVLFVGLCFGAEDVKDQKKISAEKMKQVYEQRQQALKVVKDVAFKTQPDVLYQEYMKGETMVPNLEPVKNRVYGKRSAKNKLVVLADFACGHCKVASRELKSRVNENQDLVNLTYVFYPLNGACNKAVKGKLSDYSCLSAKLALCAEKEGKVWKAIDYLYERQEDSRKLPFDTNAFVKDMNTKLKTKDLAACITSKWVEDKLVNETLVHKNLKIPGTPIVILNNKRFGNVYKSKELFAKFIKFLDLKVNAQGK